MDGCTLAVALSVKSESVFLDGRPDGDASRRRRSLTTIAFHLAV
jgi:hypothetical protein